MSSCVEVINGSLQVVGELTDSCGGFALMTAQEARDIPTLAALFAVPDAETVARAFMAGCGLPLILWLTAWGFASVLHFWSSRGEQPTLEED
ncbi:hypothetical protein [Pseudomonas nitroreducens]|uniref:Uncharacterized protein n=1 Tax=Pseudomonas nitroreducens TaxID=46680 RepID=A0A6G6IXX4_PSENT|nr:hypothetical protein [Pseudomonas nitroreducens]QIE87782.1 hypothetical protein G5B91_16495 [Pseudomonas nitroreducens]QIE87793.1 hypothetical protein G5B91_16550 [Pseudomonas nitroreducens]QIE87804.1 hypothetical protein G5B91_16605 [Pseudomonas nitroreducens]